MAPLGDITSAHTLLIEDPGRFISIGTISPPATFLTSSRIHLFLTLIACSPSPFEFRCDLPCASGRLLNHSPTNGERRTIPVNTTVLNLLKFKYVVGPRTTDMVFHSQTNTPLDGSNIRRSLTAALDIAKIQDLHFHDLRHTFATRMVQAGIDLYKVQRLLGHKSPIMTQRYAHHYPESLRDGVNALEAGGLVSTNLAHTQVRSGEASVSH